MEEFINNPGLQHLAEKVFFNLNVEDSKICTHINKSCEQILENPMFWLRKFGDGISKKNQKEWIKIIQSEEKNPKKRKDIIAYLQWNFKKEINETPTLADLIADTVADFLEKSEEEIPDEISIKIQTKPNEVPEIAIEPNEDDVSDVKATIKLPGENEESVEFMANIRITSDTKINREDFADTIFHNFDEAFTDLHKTTMPTTTIASTKDLPCYSNSDVQEDFRKKILEICEKEESSDKDIEIVTILAPLIDNPNAPDNDGFTPIYRSSCNGHTEIIKILAPLSENPNAPQKHGYTPIHKAALYGNTEIVKILAPLTDNPNAPSKDGYTPLYVAKLFGNTEIVKFLAPVTGTAEPMGH